jgi:cell division protein FtsQ
MKSPTMLRERRVATIDRGRPKSRAGRSATIDPRLDARRRSVNRSHSRRRRTIVITVAVVAGLAASVWPLAHSALFSATALEVVGNNHTSTQAVLEAAGLVSHPPLIDVNTGASAQAVEALPWVASAEVELHWPDGVVVRVSERTVAAAAAEGSRWAELDKTGRVLSVVASPPTGIIQLASAGTPGAPGTTLRAARAALVVATALPVAFRSLVVTVAPSPGGGIDLALSNGIGVVFGTATQLPSKFEDIASLLAGANLAPGSVMDVSVPESPAVTPAAPPASSSTG